MRNTRILGALICSLSLLAACTTNRDATSGPTSPDAWASRIPADEPRQGGGFNEVSTSGAGTCAITTWSVQCWGQVAQPNLFDLRSITVSSSGVCAIGEGRYAWCHGGGLEIPDGYQGPYIALSRGASYACGILDEFSTTRLVCWGGGAPQPVPTGDFVDVSSSEANFACAARADGTLACWGNNKFNRATPPPGNGFTKVTTGLFHACALKSDGTVDCWGENSFGRAHPPAVNAGFKQVSAGSNHNCALKTDGSILCWGDHTQGQSTPKNPNSGFMQVDAGGNVTCAVRTDYTVDCWGFSGSGAETPTSTHYKWSGFLAPVLREQINPAIAGQPVLIPFSLGSDEGMAIFANGWPRTRVCGAGQTSVATVGQLTYDAASNTYFYLWKTEPAWQGSCRVFVLQLNDGTSTRTAQFRFQ